MDSETSVVENNIPPTQDSLNSTITDKNSEEQEAIKLLKTALNGLGTEKISAYSQLINNFKYSQNDEILIPVAMAYFQSS